MKPRYPRRVAQRQQLCRLVRGLDERHGVGQHGGLGVLAVRVVLAQGGVGGDAFAQEVAGGGGHGLDWAGHCSGLRWAFAFHMREIAGFGQKPK